MMSSNMAAGEVGISPVLLQAITQTLSTNAVKKEKHSTDAAPHLTDSQESQQVIVSYDTADGPIARNSANAHILQGMNEPVATLTAGGETIVVIQNVDSEGETTQPPQQIYIKQMPQQNSEKSVVSDHNVPSSGAPTDFNMGSVLSAIASHLKNNRRGSISQQEEAPPVTMGYSIEDSPQPLTVCVPSTSQFSVPSPANDITVSDIDNVVTETIVHTMSNCESPPPQKRIRTEYADSTQETTTLVVNTEGMADGTLLQAVHTEHGITVTQINAADSPHEVISGPCPICSDRISGYHYGIYTCESCKGFFKRTVQNKKAFICHRKGECAVNITSRKKCPACRFKRCIMAGMRLDAIREDRTRGGRSSYDGCSPHGRGKGSISPVAVKVGRPAPTSRKVVQVMPPSVTQAQSESKSRTIMVPTSSGGHVLAVLNMDDQSGQEGETQEVVVRSEEDEEPQLAQPQPQTPQTLEDLLTLESLMMEEEGEQACCEGKLRDGDQDPFGSLLHIADHCLYKIVRWARNLPDFAAISTDDQILLLQNCWADLLCFSVCWNSVHGEDDDLHLSHGRLFSLEMAKVLGLAEVTQRLIDFTHQLRSVGIDMHEFIAMKALILMTPDVKGLKQADILRDYQDKIAESLLIYSITHYPDKPNKHCILLARLAELTRTCNLGKDLLSARQAAGEIPQFSLLSELLKGDIVVQAGE